MVTITPKFKSESRLKEL